VTAIDLVGVPMDLGGSLRGVDMGPSACRQTGLGGRLRALGHAVTDTGNIDIPVADELPATPKNALYLSAITAVCRAVAVRTFDIVDQGHFPLVIGGDHALSMGSIAGAAAAYRVRGERVGLVWLDAHADLNTPDTSRTGNVHGMPLAHLLGEGAVELAGLCTGIPAIHASDVALVGVRDLDPPERERLRILGVRAFSMREIDERGLQGVMREAIDIASRNTSGIYVSCDLDWVDPVFAPGVGTPVQGGATYREAHLAMELLSDTRTLIGMDLAELNPAIDERSRTAQLGVELAASALGKRIL